MLPKIDPTETSAWSALEEHFHELSKTSLRSLFERDPSRVRGLSVQRDGLYVDFSKHRITEHTFSLFDQLCTECRVDEGIEAMMAGKAINETEGRAVLHTALRDRSPEPLWVDGVDVKAQAAEVRDRMKRFAGQVIDGSHKGATGKPIKHVVNIGIGGSDLGPHMVVEALKHYRNHLDVRFVSNVDASHLVETLKDLDPARTLFLIASKTFTTQETMTNARSARAWWVEKMGSDAAIGQHFAALSTNESAVNEFGIPSSQMFEFWDWVGGRYSLWSAIGLSIMLAVGEQHFDKLLDGAYEADCELQSHKSKSLPARLAQLSIWYNNFFEAESHAILPYDQYLHRFPAFLQQGDMESNGKRVNRNGKELTYQSGTLIWGEPGTNGQHAFYQLIHQGTKLVPCDFIAFANPLHHVADHHEKLLANCFAQSKALMEGKTAEEARIELIDSGFTSEEVEKLVPFKVFPGNVPSTTLLFGQLTPYNLGRLIATYEHKIFVEGLLLNIFSFDQWGVELGKQLAKPILSALMKAEKSVELDSSTHNLLRQVATFRASHA